MTAKGGQSVIDVQAVSVSYGSVDILHGVTFTVPSGGITGLLGPNGAGKTTTMRVVATLIKPSSGRVLVGGHDAEADPLAVRRCIGLLTEEPGVYDRLTVSEQLLLSALSYGRSPRAARSDVERLAGLLGFESVLSDPGARLSKGTRQKVALARALVHDPSVILLDEPTAGLDVTSAAALEEFLRSSEMDGRTVLLSTHQLDQVERLCSRVVGISGGSVFLDSSPADVVSSTCADDFRTGFLSLLTEELAAQVTV